MPDADAGDHEVKGDVAGKYHRQSGLGGDAGQADEGHDHAEQEHHPRPQGQPGRDHGANALMGQQAMDTTTATVARQRLPDGHPRHGQDPFLEAPQQMEHPHAEHDVGLEVRLTLET